MATVDTKGRVRGTCGSVVYRRYREQNIVQGKPRKFKQTQESVRASTEFGLCSSPAAVIRSAFEPAFIHHDGEACSRTTTQVYRALRGSLSGSPGQRDLHDADLQELVGMEFMGYEGKRLLSGFAKRVCRDTKIQQTIRSDSDTPRGETGNLKLRTKILFARD